MFDLRIPLELKHMEFINVIESPTVEGLGILILGENLDEQENVSPVIRIYQLTKIDGMFEIEKELHAFSFYNLDKALTFAKDIPKMSALELLIAMNTISPESIVN